MQCVLAWDSQMYLDQRFVLSQANNDIIIKKIRLLKYDNDVNVNLSSM